MDTRLNDGRAVEEPGLAETDDFPLRVAPDWDRQAAWAEEACRVIDAHVVSEGKGRMLRAVGNFVPAYLGPEQRVQMMTDLYAAVTREGED